jgi:hypothetical protein
MAILEDIKRLGIILKEQDQDEIEMIVAKVSEEKKDDPFVRDALIEYTVNEFLNVWCPEVVEELVKDKQRQSDEWVRLTQRKYDEKGDRICDEQFCASTEGVAQCAQCGKCICKEHNYGEGSLCCYDCWLAKFKQENKSQAGE